MYLSTRLTKAGLIVNYMPMTGDSIRVLEEVAGSGLVTALTGKNPGGSLAETSPTVIIVWAEGDKGMALHAVFRNATDAEDWIIDDAARRHERRYRMIDYFEAKLRSAIDVTKAA